MEVIPTTSKECPINIVHKPDHWLKDVILIANKEKKKKKKKSLEQDGRPLCSSS
jgi:hypothetical protein